MSSDDGSEEGEWVDDGHVGHDVEMVFVGVESNGMGNVSTEAVKQGKTIT